MPQVSSFLDNARRAPRLTKMFEEFQGFASGTRGQPAVPVSADRSLLGADPDVAAVLTTQEMIAGTFNAHFVASIPYVLEEQARFSAALLAHLGRLAERERRPALLYTLGDAEGVNARTVATLAGGAVHTLTCSPNPENRDEFYRCGAPPESHFFVGPFFDVTPESLRNSGLSQFAAGFDVLVEDTTFQMYGPQRREQIALACRNLRSDGIFVAVEKLHPGCEDEYLRREEQKDTEFKARYFTKQQITAKRERILTHMERMEVTIDEMRDALSCHFSAAAITWNSGNFYTVAASNDRERLREFVSAHSAPAIPDQFQYGELPRPLFGLAEGEVAFRTPQGAEEVSA
ncbi:hypothetical protein OOT09_18870 [Streptomyces sp. NBC_00199]|nr:hypothetical protein [Streptomyces sp. NBC_00199]